MYTIFIYLTQTIVEFLLCPKGWADIPLG